MFNGFTSLSVTETFLTYITISMKQKKLSRNKTAILAGTLAISAMLTGSAFAAEDSSSSQNTGGSFMKHMKGTLGHTAPTAFGKITAINGTSITIVGKSNTTYTVDAANAKILKGKNKAAALSDLAVNNMIVVEGTLNGTTITATSIRVGGPRGVEGGKPSIMAPKGVMGTVSTVTGTNFTVASHAFLPHMKGSTTTVATIPTTLVNVVTGSNTVFMKDGVTSSITAVVSGARVIVEGTKDAAGTTVTATKVIVITKNPGMMEGRGHSKMHRNNGAKTDN